jgi:hypothetical protein
VGNGKKVSRSAHIGDAGIALIHQRVSAMDHVWHERKVDAGIDGTIELRDPTTGEVSNCHLQVQSKASDNDFPGETTDRFHYDCDERDLDYWMKSPVPVLLICSHPKRNEAWWVHIQAYFSDPARRASGRVDFHKITMAFAGDVSDRLFAVSDPHGRAHTPVADFREETLESNLVPVSMPDVFWSYEAVATTPRKVYDLQRESGLEIRDDFTLFGGRLLTWNLVEGTALGGAVRSTPTPGGDWRVAGWQPRQRAGAGASPKQCAARGHARRLRLPPKAPHALLPRDREPSAAELEHQGLPLALGLQVIRQEDRSFTGQLLQARRAEVAVP